MSVNVGGLCIHPGGPAGRRQPCVKVGFDNIFFPPPNHFPKFSKNKTAPGNQPRTSTSARASPGAMTQQQSSSGLLRIRLLRGINLAVRDLHTRSSDPYVIISSGQQKVKSRVVKRNCNPEWNEELTLGVYNPNQPLHLNVFDKDKFTSDDKIGEANIEILPLIASLNKLKMQSGDGEPSEDGAVVARVLPNAENCLDTASNIVCKNGKLIQDMCLILKNVECGSVEIQLEWIYLHGSSSSNLRK